MKKIFTIFLLFFSITAISQTRLSLPFTEDFSSGSLNTNHWTVTGGQNWRLSSTMGNPTPCIVFYGDKTNYEQTLESDFLNGTQFSSGAIYFDFSFQSSVISATGNEILTIEVYNGTSWQAIKEFDNGAGGISWSPYHFDITNLAAGKNFKIRFRAHGVDFSVMNFWMIDNISIFNSPLGIKENQSGAVNVYPNPASAIVNLQMNESIDHITIYDLLGNEKQIVTVLNRESSIKVDLSDHKPGIYFVKFTGISGKIITRKLVIK